MAVTDKAEAYSEFLKCNRMFKRIYLVKNATRDLRYPMIRFVMNHGQRERVANIFGNLGFIMPGNANYQQYA